MRNILWLLIFTPAFLLAQAPPVRTKLNSLELRRVKEESFNVQRANDKVVKSQKLVAKIPNDAKHQKQLASAQQQLAASQKVLQDAEARQADWHNKVLKTHHAGDGKHKIDPTTGTVVSN